jgi:hypothetical protein
MRPTIGTFLIVSVFAQFSHAQKSGSAAPAGREASMAASAAVRETSTIDSYIVFNAPPAQEAALRVQIRLTHPDVLPLRVFFVPHGKYLAAARDFQLHVPKATAS